VSAQLKRRDFITLLGGAAAALPLAARAQQSAMPVIGFLSNRGATDSTGVLAAFHGGLKQLGFINGQTVAVEYRWANGQYDQLPALAADLVRRQVAVIAAMGGDPTVFAAKAATASIPIVFSFSDDPVSAGLIASFNRPGGNLTGVTLFSTALGTKRLELLRQLMPKAASLAMLVNPNFLSAEREVAQVQAAAQANGLQVLRLNASTTRELTAAFATLAERKVEALLVASDSFFVSAREDIAAMAARHAVPTIYAFPDFARAGGLMSYGTSFSDVYYKAGVYTARILKGNKPSDLPIEQATKFELVINLRAAKALGLEVPDKLLALADEVIE
jgi:putative tryptophan/tyrosine transport system substrate-binding protein